MEKWKPEDGQGTQLPSECSPTEILPSGGGIGQQATELGSRAALPEVSRKPCPSIAGYVIDRELGRGGMGVVYKARQKVLARDVALKVVLSGEHASSEQIARFTVEAETAARLRHQGIVQIYESGQTDDLPYFSMEYVDGGSLADRLASGKLVPAEAAELIRELAEAVAHAHECGVAHRDLKPANILLTVDGRPKVTDFGLAKRMMESDGLTRTGSIMGTPYYMAPEQARGDIRAVGPASDIYALGAVLYHCLSGGPPFSGKSTAEILSQVVSQPPPSVRRVGVEIPRDLETIAMKCLEKEPSRRYASAKSLAEDLRRWQEGRTITARRVSQFEKTWRWMKRNPLLASLMTTVFVLLTAVAGISLFAFVKVDRARRDAVMATSREADAKIAAEREAKAASAARDDAQRKIVRLYLSNAKQRYDAGDDGGGLLWEYQAWQADPSPENEASHRARLGVALSVKPSMVGLAVHDVALADGRIDDAGELVITKTVTRQANLWRIREGKRVIPPIAHEGGVDAIGITPDGRFALTAGADSMARVWNADGQMLVEVNHSSPVEAIDVRKDGKVFVTAGGSNGVRFWEVATGQEVLQGLDVQEAETIKFSPDGKRVATTDADGHARVWDLTDGSPLTPPLPCRPRDAFAKLWNTRSGPVFSPNGRQLLTTDGQYQAEIYQLSAWDTATGKRLWQGPSRGSSHFQVYSPNGRRVIGCQGGASLFDSSNGLLVASLTTPRECQRAAFIGPKRVATASTSGLLTFWGLVGDQPSLLGTTIQLAGDVREMVALPDERHLFVVSADGTARLFDTWLTPVNRFPSGRADRIVDRSGNRVKTYSADGTKFFELVAGSSPKVNISDSNNPPVTLDVTGAIGGRFSRDGDAIITFTENSLRGWSTKTGQAMGPEILLPETTDMAMRWTSFVINGDGSRVVESDRSRRSIRVYDMINGKTLLERTFDPSEELTSNQPDISWDGSRVVTGDFAYSGAVEVWQVSPPVRLSRFFPHRGNMRPLSMSPDGERIMVSSSDTTARLWKADGTPIGPLLQHARYCEGGELAANGRQAVTWQRGVGGRNGTVYLWDAEIGDRLGRWPLPSEVQSCWFSADTRTLWVAATDGYRGFTVEAVTTPADMIPSVIDLVTGQRIDVHSEGIEYLPVDTFISARERYLEAWRAWRGQSE